MILPGTGRGTMRSMVVGAGLLAHNREDSTQPIAPSTTFCGPPPRFGEDL